MARHAGPVLVDTNIILESYRVGSWRALAGGYGVQTVEECVDETEFGEECQRQSAVVSAADAGDRHLIDFLDADLEDIGPRVNQLRCRR